VQGKNGRWYTTRTEPDGFQRPVGKFDGWPDQSTANAALKVIQEQAIPNQTFGEWYRTMNSPMANTEQMAKAGIPGIKYLDQGSRAGDRTRWVAQHPQGGINDFANEQEARAFVAKNPEYSLQPPNQTRNYVVFDDNAIDILRKYGMAGLIAAGAAHYKESQ
jgi:hypothetical protein